MFINDVGIEVWQTNIIKCKTKMAESSSNVIVVNPIIWNIVKTKSVLAEEFPLLRNVEKTNLKSEHFLISERNILMFFNF